ncbi:uncharacterized protein LOC133492023 isoform X3 [Syngnathoides biaculeatus]|uniref:uncharacterized protein LOC133492023 isoform X3 n=1 Tax=Syngnathoides biaculeatus TaxID=300417 RepID=UPI002ADE53D5|nr:uncharacterized protein LOC133492023 isoform X3 [Syngnathoides biaculeatus]
MSGGEGDKILVRALETCSVSSKLSSSSTSGDNRLPAFKDARSRDASKNWEIHGTTCTGPHSKTFFSVDLDICNGQSKLLISLWAPLYPPSRTCILFKRGQEQAVSYRTIRILATTSSSSFARIFTRPHNSTSPLPAREIRKRRPEVTSSSILAAINIVKVSAAAVRDATLTRFPPPPITCFILRCLSRNVVPEKREIFHFTCCKVITFFFVEVPHATSLSLIQYTICPSKLSKGVYSCRHPDIYWRSLSKNCKNCPKKKKSLLYLVS